MKFKYSDLSWKEIEERTNDVVFLVVGSTEQNGPHSPLATDTIVVEGFANEVAKKTGSLVLDTIPFSYSAALRGFPGTVYLKPATFEALIRDVCACLVKHGFKKIVAVNHHAPNQQILEHALRDVRDDHGVMVPVIFTAGVLKTLNKGLFPSDTFGHGAEPTNSVVMALAPETMRMEWAVKDAPTEYMGLKVSSSSVSFFEDCPVGMFIYSDEVSKTGIWGDPTKADPEKGKELFERLVDWGVRFVRMFKEA